MIYLSAVTERLKSIFYTLLHSVVMGLKIDLFKDLAKQLSPELYTLLQHNDLTMSDCAGSYLSSMCVLSILWAKS